MHLQHAWFQLYFEHQVAMSCTFLVVPQGQEGHFPEGQFPPHESAVTKPMMNKARIKYFMLILL